MKYYSIGICIIIAYSLLGMEVLSLELEYPFGREFNHLPMDSMTKQTLSELFDSYSTTVNLPRAELSDSAADEKDPMLKQASLATGISSDPQCHPTKDVATRFKQDDSCIPGLFHWPQGHSIRSLHGIV